MGLMDDIAGAAQQGGGSLLAGGEGGGAMSVISGLIGQGGAGLPGLLEKFNAGGLGDIASSWVAKGPNKPVSGSQLQSVLGSDAVAGIASRLGLPADQAASGIAAVLPQIVDRLTPDGKVPDSGSLAGMVQGLFSKL